MMGGGMGGGMGPNFFMPQNLPQMLPQMLPQIPGMGQGMLPMQIPLAQGGVMGQVPLQADQVIPPEQGVPPLFTDPALIYGSTLSPTAAPGHPAGCQWACLINETVTTRGRSNEDDALYELFYTNPLNCCGTIVEIGAETGLEHSTSYFFENGMNWTAILTEADPLSYAQIAEHRTGKKMKSINGAFCKEGPFLYYDFESRKFQSSRVQGNEAEEYASELLDPSLERTASVLRVDCIRLDHILAGIDHINVMVIRVKGDPWAALRTMDWSIVVDIWVIQMDDGQNDYLHDTIRTALKLHDYVPAVWDIKLWCETPTNCMKNEVWLRKQFNPMNKPLLGHLRGTINNGDANYA